MVVGGGTQLYTKDLIPSNVDVACVWHGGARICIGDGCGTVEACII